MKNKKSIFAIMVMAIVVVVGMTLAAYFTDTNLSGLFHTEPYNTSITELFVSPDNWAPGQTTQKKVYATNESNTDVVVRISLDESWTSQNGDELNKFYNGDPVAIINFSDNSDWIKIGDYYYYDGVLSKNDITTDFIDSVTFNKDIEIDDTCTTSDDESTITCLSSGDWYDAGKYTLTLNVEMVQADFYKDAWNIDYDLGSKSYKNYLAPYLVSKANSDSNVDYLDANKRELYTFEQADTPQFSHNTDYRYIGDSPNNYVYYNCSDDSDVSTCEKWRIIGVFYVEDENGDFHQQVKIMKPDVYQNLYWNSSQKSWIGSNAQTSLNSGTYWNTLSNTAQEMVSNTKYYIAKMNNLGSNNSASTWYYNERTLESYTDSQPYSIDKFALMYPSDYLYTFGKGVNDGCYNNSYSCSIPSGSNSTYNSKMSWIYNSNKISNQTNNSNLWFMNPQYSYGDYYLASLTGNGSINEYYLSNYASAGIRPVAYLKPGVIWISGDGSETNPYKIQLLKYNITIDNNLFTVPNQGTVRDKYYLEHADIYEIDSFKLNDVIVTGDSFIMPEEDAAITDIVYRQIIYYISSEETGITYPNRMHIGQNVTIESTSDEYAVKSFKINGETVTGDSFVMPEENVEITDVEFKPAYYSITNTDTDVNVPSSARIGTTVQLTGDDYIINSFKVNGETVMGDSFVMPEEDVTITDISKTIRITVESSHYPYSGTGGTTVYFERTFEEASSITVELTYETLDSFVAYINLYKSSNELFNKYGGQKKTETITIPSNYLKITFYAPTYSTNYYGFKAVITPNY